MKRQLCKIEPINACIVPCVGIEDTQINAYKQEMEKAIANLTVFATINDFEDEDAEPIKYAIRMLAEAVAMFREWQKGIEDYLQSE